MKSITSALEMSPGSAVSSDPGDEEEEEEDIEESHSQAALDATGASQVSVPDETEYDEVFEDSNIKIEKWEDEEDDEDDREDEDEEEEEEEDYSRENDDKWEDDEDDVSDNVKANEKQSESEVERSVKYEEPERPKFASFAGTSHSFHLVLSSCLFLSCSVLSLASAALVLSLCCLFADFLL
jgi:hypothetical protein